MIIDSHAHLNFKSFQDADEVIRRSLDNDTWMINVGSQLFTSKRAIELAQKYDNGAYAAVGLHPIHIGEQEIEGDEEKTKEKYNIDDLQKVIGEVRALAQDNKVVAIGEVGLDYFHFSKNCDVEKIKDWQKEYLVEFINLANELNKPLILHCRGSKDNPQAAYEDLLEVLTVNSSQKNLNIDHKHTPNPSPSIGRAQQEGNIRVVTKLQEAKSTLERGFRGVSGQGVLHCYGSNLETAKKFINLGFKIGFTGIITFKNAKDLQDVAADIDLKDILIETDCPYLSPEPFRGKRNEPIYVKYIAQKIVEIKGISYKEVAKVTFENTRELFGILS